MLAWIDGSRWIPYGARHCRQIQLDSQRNATDLIVEEYPPPESEGRNLQCWKQNNQYDREHLSNRGTMNGIEIVTFKVFERLTVNVILACDFCDKHVKAIDPQKSVVELDDGITNPIFRNPSSRHHDEVPLAGAQQIFQNADAPQRRLWLRNGLLSSQSCQHSWPPRVNRKAWYL